MRLLQNILCISLTYSMLGLEGAGAWTANNRPGTTLIIMAAPQSSSSYYKETYDDTIKFQAEYARKISAAGNDSVIILADSKTITKLKQLGVPQGVLRLANSVKDIWIRDFGLVGINQQQAFIYSPNYLGRRLSKRIQNSLLGYFESKGVYPKGEPNVIIDGGNVVDNGIDTAIVTNRIYDDKFNYQTNSDVENGIKSALGYSKLVVLNEEQGDTTGHSDGMVAFIDENTVAISDTDQYSRIKRQIKNAGFNTVLLESKFEDAYWKSFASSCGLHVNLLATDKHLYVPVFGDDALDNKVVGAIESNTHKSVVRIHVPHAVCKMGGSVRCLTMAIKGTNANKLINSS